MKWRGSFTYEGDSEACYLPTNFAREVGLHKKTQNRLARMNDKGASFDEIANHIERNY